MPAAGLLARGSMPPLGLPGANGSSGRWKGARRLQLRGQPRSWVKPSPRSLLRPALMREPTTARTIAVCPRFARAPSGDALTKGRAGRLKWPRSTVSRMRGTGNAVRAESPKSAAAPATVSGEPEPQSHWERPGKAAKAETREPGDLPSILVARRAGCLGAVGSLADRSGFRAVRRHAPLKSRRSVQERRQGDSHRHRSGRRSGRSRQPPR